MRTSTLIDRDAAQALQIKAVAAGDLVVWTVYQCPRDFPTLFVGRPHVANRQGTYPLPSHLEALSLDALRVQLPTDLHRLDRQPEDEPQIVEVWL